MLAISLLIFSTHKLVKEAQVSVTNDQAFTKKETPIAP